MPYHSGLNIWSAWPQLQRFSACQTGFTTKGSTCSKCPCTLIIICDQRSYYDCKHTHTVYIYIQYIHLGHGSLKTNLKMTHQGRYSATGGPTLRPAFLPLPRGCLCRGRDFSMADVTAGLMGKKKHKSTPLGMFKRKNTAKLGSLLVNTGENSCHDKNGYSRFNIKTNSFLPNHLTQT